MNHDNYDHGRDAEIERLCEMRLSEILILFQDVLSAKLEEMGVQDKAFALSPVRPTDQATAATIIYLIEH